MTTPFHAGEVEMQDLAGERDMASRTAGVITAQVPRGAIAFVSRQRMAVVASVDSNGKVWASVLFGEEGFVEASSDGGEVAIDLTKAVVSEDDNFWANIESDPRVGLLMIELTSRRRLRVNGTVAARSENRLLLAVREAYPNCPKYIQRRHLRFEETPAGVDRPVFSAKGLTQEQAAIVRRADTLFVGSANGSSGLDASHRGGPRGFVEVLDGDALRIPDYTGNGMFNTLGNLRVDPRVGLVFVDFDRGRIVQLTGTAAVELNAHDPRGQTGGTRRFWEVTIERTREWSAPAAIAWEYIDASPFNPTPLKTPDDMA